MYNFLRVYFLMKLKRFVNAVSSIFASVYFKFEAEKESSMLLDSPLSFFI